MSSLETVWVLTKSAIGSQLRRDTTSLKGCHHHLRFQNYIWFSFCGVAIICQHSLTFSRMYDFTHSVRAITGVTTCRNYLFIVKLENSATKIWMGRLPFSHVRMNYFWWAKTERIVVYSAVNLLFRNNKIQLSKCHYITIFMNCKISLTYISETHWKQSIKFQIESMFHFPFS